MQWGPFINGVANDQEIYGRIFGCRYSHALRAAWRSTDLNKHTNNNDRLKNPTGFAPQEKSAEKTHLHVNRAFFLTIECRGKQLG